MWEWPRKPLTHDLAYTPYPSYHCNTTHSKHCYTVSVIPTPFLGPSIPYRLQVPLLSGSHAAIQTQLQAPSNFLSFEQGRGATPSGLDKKTQVLTNEPVLKSNQALVCNCERTLIDPHHIYFPILQLTIKLSNSLCLLTMLCLTPSRSYWRSLIKRTGRLNSNHRHFVTLGMLAVGHRISWFFRHKVSHLLGGRVKVMRNTRQLFLNYLLTRRGWLRIVSSIIRPAIHFLGPH